MDTQRLLNAFASLAYYAEKGTGGVSFEKLVKEEQGGYYKRAEEFLGYCDKLNLELVKRRSEKELQAEKVKANQTVDDLELMIAEFVKGFKRTHININTFPCRELAARIVNPG